MQKTKLWAMVIVASLLLAFSGSCAFGKEAPRVDKETLKSWLSDPQVIIVDVRNPKIGRAATKKSRARSVRIPKRCKPGLPAFPKTRKSSCIAPERSEGTSARVAQELLKMGFSQVWALKGGWEEWDKLGYPTEPK